MDEEQKAFAEQVAKAINAHWDEQMAKAIDSGDSRGWCVEVKAGTWEWTLWVERTDHGWWITENEGE